MLSQIEEKNFLEVTRKMEEDYFKFLRKRIREAREEKGMTQEELGRAIRKSRVVISDFETGRTEVNAADLMKIAHVLEKPIKYFFPIRDVPSEDELTTEEWELILQFRKIEQYPELRKFLIGEARRLAEIAEIKNIEMLEKMLREEKRKMKDKIRKEIRQSS